MKNATTPTDAIGSRLLSAILWELSLLGHKSIDLVKTLLRPGGWFRRLPHVRILLVLSMVILILNEDISFSLRLGEPAPASTTSATQPQAASAGLLHTPVNFVSNLFSSPAFAKTTLTLMDSKTGIALINRFEATALAEQEKFGVDAGVLLATAIASGVVDSPEQVMDKKFATNYFGEALTDTYPTAWSSWRAMSLTILASIQTERPTRDDFVQAAATHYPDSDQTKERIYEALRFYQL